MTQCLVCRSDDVKQFLDLGEMELANSFLTEEELSRSEPTYPLQVGFCDDCHHVQLMERVPPSAMFESYLYVSSASDTLKRHLHGLAAVITERYGLGPDHLVVDIGSNDGTLLSGFRSSGVRILGIDPAENLASLALKVGVETYTAFFGSETAAKVAERFGRASVITATNTFPHIPDLVDFLAGIHILLDTDGIFVIEVHYLADLLEQGAFDTVYHEHVSYWALGPMIDLFNRHGLQVVDVERLPVHHGQLRVFVQRDGHDEVQPSVDAVLEAESELGLDRFETYERFARQTMKIREDLRATIQGIVAHGESVVGYGAPAKASTLLSFLEIGRDEIEYIVDRSPLKQGLYTPGRHIPIVAPERLLDDQPDYALLLAWNFADEVLEQQAEYRKRGGKFILPIPEVKIIDGRSSRGDRALGGAVTERRQL